MASLSSLYVSSSSSSPLPPHRNLNSFFRHGSNLPNPTRSSSSSTRRSRSTISLSFRTSYRFSVDHEDEDEEEDQIARDSCFDEAVDLFNRGAYYDCHDVLEILWNGAEDPTRTLIHGILQCAVGLHHLFNRNHKGAMMELGEGLCKLRKMEFRSGPFFTFEREISAVLDFVYQTQIELAAFSIRPVPELMRASFDTLKYYKERFSRGRKVGTLVTDELLLESGLLDYNPAVRLIESSRPNSELAMVCGFASSVKRKSKGRAHALEAVQSSKPTTPAVAGPASEDPAPVVELESSGGPSREKRPRDQTEAVDAPPLGEEVREEAPLKQRRKKKKAISPSEVGACRVLPASFADRVDDPAARMGGMSDVTARFRVEPSSSGVRDQVSCISAASLDRCLRRASKFVSDPGSVLQRTIDYAAEAFVASIQSALAVKAELDGREVLAAREKEEFSAALEAASSTMKDELLKAMSPCASYL